MKTKKIKALSIALVTTLTPLSFFAQQWSGPSNTTSSIFRSGKVGIGTTAAAVSTDPQLDVFCTNVLPSAPLGANVFVNRMSGSSGSNLFANNTWLVRNSNSSSNTWTTTSLHNGISIDGMYGTPGTDTRTWWDRNAYSDIQSWGDQGNPYMTLKQGNFTVYRKASVGTYYSPGDAAAWYNPKPAPGLDVYALNTLGGVGDAQLLSSFSGPVGTSGASSTIRSNTWLYRKGAASPYSFSNIVVHDGLSIDASYMTPGTDTKTWWERDAMGDKQAWGTNQNEYMRLEGGKLLLGGKEQNSSSSYNGALLQVNGTAVATQVIVTQQNWNTWPDFVFDKNYKLMPLGELESFYKKNHHLPEVPSAAEISEKGVDLAKTNAIMLQKVEELTLYVVELQKQFDELKKKSNN